MLASWASETLSAASLPSFILGCSGITTFLMSGTAPTAYWNLRSVTVRYLSHHSESIRFCLYNLSPWIWLPATLYKLGCPLGKSASVPANAEFSDGMSFARRTKRLWAKLGSVSTGRSGNASVSAVLALSFAGMNSII
eukprot:scaffold51117_cov75-Phaeocystis_antarctica.AAC.4